MIKQIFQNELMLIKQKHQKNVIFVIIGIFQTRVFVVSVKESDYRIYFWYISKDDAINVIKTSDFKKVDY